MKIRNLQKLMMFLLLPSLLVFAQAGSSGEDIWKAVTENAELKDELAGAKKENAGLDKLIPQKKLEWLLDNEAKYPAVTGEILLLVAANTDSSEWLITNPKFVKWAVKHPEAPKLLEKNSKKPRLMELLFKQQLTADIIGKLGKQPKLAEYCLKHSKSTAWLWMRPATIRYMSKNINNCMKLMQDKYNSIPENATIMAKFPDIQKFFPKQINAARFIFEHINFSEYMKGEIEALESGKKTMGEDEKDDKTVYKTPKKLEGNFYYYQDFEKADNNDEWLPNGSGMDIIWQKKGCDDSRGCIKFTCPSDKGFASSERYFNMSIWCKADVEFDYFVSGCSGEVFFTAGSYVGSGYKPELNVRYKIEKPVIEKWTHVKIKWADLLKADQYAEKWGERKVDSWNISKNNPGVRTYGDIAIGIAGLEKECKDSYMLIDNVFLKAIDEK